MAVPEGARVSIFLGKGGVGKTTVACAFAYDRARAGERVLLLSPIGSAELRARMLAESGTQVLPATLDVALLDPKRLVDAIAKRITRLGPMGDLLVRQPGYESLVDIAPGVKEMAVLNLVWNRRREGYDRVVLDGPATGHGLHFLEAPQKMASILVGRLRERALEIRDLLQDPRATEAVVVTLPEEMPVREASELAEVLKREGFPLDNVVVNKWFPRLFDRDDARDLLAKLEGSEETRRGLERAIAHRTRFDVESWLRAVDLIRAQRAEALEHLRQLERLGAKLGFVPYVPEVEGRLLRVAEALQAPPPKEVSA